MCFDVTLYKHMCVCVKINFCREIGNNDIFKLLENYSKWHINFITERSNVSILIKKYLMNPLSSIFIWLASMHTHTHRHRSLSNANNHILFVPHWRCLSFTSFHCDYSILRIKNIWFNFITISLFSFLISGDWEYF